MRCWIPLISLVCVGQLTAEPGSPDIQKHSQVHPRSSIDTNDLTLLTLSWRNDMNSVVSDARNLDESCLWIHFVNWGSRSRHPLENPHQEHIDLATSVVSRTHPGERENALSPQKQQALAKELGKKVQRFEMWTDDDGNVTGLTFINHQALNSSIGEKPGIQDADLLQFKQFSNLTAVNFEAQPISDQGLKILREFPSLKQVGFHYMAKAKGAKATPDFITVIEGMRDLEIIEIKHNFKMKSIHVQKLKQEFPNVWRLVLDTPCTAEQTMHLIRRCPNVTDLQLHRTEITPDQLSEIGRLLPKLEVLWLKVKGGLRAGHLNAMPNFPQLKILSPQSFQEQVSYDDGWASLSKLPKLQRLEIFGDPGNGNTIAIKQLQQLNPRLIVDKKLTRSRNYHGL